MQEFETFFAQDEMIGLALRGQIFYSFAITNHSNVFSPWVQLQIVATRRQILHSLLLFYFSKCNSKVSSQEGKIL